MMLRNLTIGPRLTVGFGLLVLLTLLVGSLNYAGSTVATAEIERTAAHRVPTALSAVRAQASVLRMVSDVRGYLAVDTDADKRTFMDSYRSNAARLREDLAELQRQAPEEGGGGQRRHREIQQLIETRWDGLPERLFALHDDELARSPAYAMMVTDGARITGQAYAQLDALIESQAQREPTAANLRLLGDLSHYQTTFFEMNFDLLGYVTTRNADFKRGYEAHRAANEAAWATLRTEETQLTAPQRESLAAIARARAAYAALQDSIITTVESDAWRQDQSLFSAQVLPVATQLEQMLGETSAHQQQSLQDDLNSGRLSLELANQRTLILVAAAVLLGSLMAMAVRNTIVGPVRRLTAVADRIRAGDLGQEARVEGRDELGILARTFNSMTSHLRQTLAQVRREKKQASDLLDVVIPIGVLLSAERDFGRMLERMVAEAMAYCRADAGILYLRGPGAEGLRYAIVRATGLGLALGGATGREPAYPPLPLPAPPTAGGGVTPAPVGQAAAESAPPAVRAAMEGTVHVLEGAAAPAGPLLGGAIVDVDPSYRVSSLLTLPLSDSQGRVEGVLQLINARDPETGAPAAFDEHTRQMMVSFSALAAAALEGYVRERRLRQEIQQLRVEIDEVRRRQQVQEIVESDFFQDLEKRARKMRQRPAPEAP